MQWSNFPSLLLVFVETVNLIEKTDLSSTTSTERISYIKVSPIRIYTARIDLKVAVILSNKLQAINTATFNLWNGLLEIICSVLRP